MRGLITNNDDLSFLVFTNIFSENTTSAGMKTFFFGLHRCLVEKIKLAQGLSLSKFGFGCSPQELIIHKTVSELAKKFPQRKDKIDNRNYAITIKMKCLTKFQYFCVVGSFLVFIYFLYFLFLRYVKEVIMCKCLREARPSVNPVMGTINLSVLKL